MKLWNTKEEAFYCAFVNRISFAERDKHAEALFQHGRPEAIHGDVPAGHSQGAQPAGQDELWHLHDGRRLRRGVQDRRGETVGAQAVRQLHRRPGTLAFGKQGYMQGI